MIIRRSSSSSTQTPTPESSREPSPCEESDARTMSTNSSHSRHSPRPLTVAIPSSFSAAGPYCMRKPSLSEILANTAPPPWTLSAFMAYLSQNHCLETLEFTMDASRYRKHYTRLANRSPGNPISPSSEEVQYVKMLWQRLVEAYIAPNGPREVNLPSDVRDGLLAMEDPYLPPSPSTLDPAVDHVYSLMQESVLVPFINSVSSSTQADSAMTSEENLAGYATSYDDRSSQRQRVRERLSSPPPSTVNTTAAASSASTFSPAPATSNRASAPSSFSHFARTFGHGGRFSSREGFSSNSSHSRALALIPSHSNSTSASNSEVLTDDSMSANSPTLDGHDDLMTPPTTPPMSDIYGYSGQSPSSGTHSNQSPRNSRGDTWKKVSSKFGWPRKKTGDPDDDDSHHHHHHSQY